MAQHIAEIELRASSPPDKDCNVLLPRSRRPSDLLNTELAAWQAKQTTTTRQVDWQFIHPQPMPAFKAPVT